MKWKIMRNGSRELVDDAGTHAVIEPSKHRGWWWWCTWGREGGDVGNLMRGRLAEVKAHAQEQARG